MAISIQRGATGRVLHGANTIAKSPTESASRRPVLSHWLTAFLRPNRIGKRMQRVTISESIYDDGYISSEEADRIRRAWESLKSATEGFVVACADRVGLMRAELA